jgi:hypothetical protein
MSRCARSSAAWPALCLLLAACGGGGSSSSDTPPPAPPDTPTGWWTGTTEGGRSVKALVLGSGAYYLYHEDGLVYGQGSVTAAGTFGDAGARHYRLAGGSTQAGPLAATFTPRSRFDGTQTDTTGTLRWTASWDSANAGTATPGAVEGAYTGVFAAQPTALPAVFAVQGDGRFAGLTGTCVFTGRLTPRVDVNAYDLTLSFGGFPCTTPNRDYAGVAYHDTTGRSLIGLATTAARDNAALLLASRN